MDNYGNHNFSVWVGHRVQSRAERGLAPNQVLQSMVSRGWVDGGDIHQDGKHWRRSRSGWGWLR